MTVDVAPHIVKAEQIHPWRDRLLVRRMKKAEKTEGGVVLPESAQDISQMGVVLAAREQTEIPVGSWIIFTVYSAIPCVATSDYDDLLFVREGDVLATVEEEIAH